MSEPEVLNSATTQTRVNNRSPKTQQSVDATKQFLVFPQDFQLLSFACKVGNMSLDLGSSHFVIVATVGLGNASSEARRTGPTLHRQSLYLDVRNARKIEPQGSLYPIISIPSYSNSSIHHPEMSNSDNEELVGECRGNSLWASNPALPALEVSHLGSSIFSLVFPTELRLDCLASISLSLALDSCNLKQDTAAKPEDMITS
ncbi:uncharacterized protein L3040_003794 [Drepanopeziza brunnea f. sp. 'multigermtubi']|uniref:uncharacterized protein n=1 Tax=Drepanopeziza brunnea f. sp. 'multigermtubi' TaxID=698441 RepID=UPI0023A2145C|nr:hypothetical protein L3040_003794 [Drepanopeziza brunnea f. sp. 'multigermtubi']